MSSAPLLRAGTFPGHFSYLLFFLLTLLIVDPLLDPYPIDPLVSHLLLGVVMLLTIYPVRNQRSFLYLGSTLAAITFVALWLARYSDSDAVRLVALGTGFIFFLHAALVILIAILRKSRISTDELAGAASAYLLIGMSGAFIFAALETLTPGSVISTIATQPVPISTSPGNSFEAHMYFSFTCLTTLGFGDLVPATPLTRVLAYLEAVIGQIYLTVLVARLVGLHLTQSRLD